MGVGCGPRTRGYLNEAVRRPDQFQVVGAADPVASRVAEIARLAGDGPFQGFASADELFDAGRIGDVAVIGTQDAYHVDPAIRAMELGYDLLLEKPVATSAQDVVDLERAADRLGRKVVVCHVLRYTSLYVKIKEILARGDIGQVMTLDAREGLGFFHQVHSYVRGHWSHTWAGTPMIIAKSCHDTDVISWMVDAPATRVASYGRLSHFTEANAPAGSPARCLDGCPVTDCFYDASRYADAELGWLTLIMDGADRATPAQRLEWVGSSPWGRCAYRCDNDAVDHQVIAMDFANGATATFTMTGFDNDGRTMIIAGTEGVLRAGDRLKNDTGAWITVTDLRGNVTEYGRDSGDDFSGHAGGDAGIIENLAAELDKPADQIRSGLPASLESHLIGYAAEQSRLTGMAVDMAAYRQQLGLPAPAWA